MESKIIQTLNEEPTKYFLDDHDSKGKTKNISSILEPIQNFVIFWQNNCGPSSKFDDQTLQPFDEKNQIHLNKTYDLFCRNANEYIYNLISPANDCAVNFIKMLLFDFDSKSFFPIKAEKNNNNFLMQASINIIKSPELKNNNSNKQSFYEIEFENNKFIHKEKEKTLIFDLEISENEEEILFFWNLNIDFRVPNEIPI